MDYNLLALLQAAQGAQRSPTMAGPVAPQSPTPGFRMPPPMSVSAPQLPQPSQGLDFSQGANMLMKGLAGFHLDSDPTNPGVPTPQGDPHRRCRTCLPWRHDAARHRQSATAVFAARARLLRTAAS